MPLGTFFCCKKMQGVNTLFGSKQKMSQTFIEGIRIPVTHIKVGPCVITQIKNKKKDGYWAVQIGCGEKKLKNITKPLQGHLKGAMKDKKAPRFLREVRLDAESSYKVGDVISVSDVFNKGDVVSVTGVTKGKGFAGVVKRWGFAGGPRTHGQSDRLRAPGSIGQGTTPGRVHKGKKMPGRMGTETRMVRNLTVVNVDSEKDEIIVSGSVSGAPNSLLTIKRVAKGKLEELTKEGEKPKVQTGKVPEKELEKEQMEKKEVSEKGE